MLGGRNEGLIGMISWENERRESVKKKKESKLLISFTVKASREVEQQLKRDVGVKGDFFKN